MKAKKLIALLLALVLVCGVLAACGGGSTAPSGGSSSGGSSSGAPSDKKPKDYNLDDWKALADSLESSGKDKYHILYLPSWAASEYFVNSYEVWKGQFEELGWTLDMQGPKEYTAESQLSTLEAALVSQAYDAIILYPIDGNAFAAVKDEQWETYHTPVIVWGMAEKTGAGQYYVMNDDRYKLVGEAMGEMAIEYVDKNADYFKKYDGQGIPVFVAQQAMNTNQNVRVLRAVELLEADGRFKIVENFEQVRDSDAMQFAESLILNHPEVEIGIMYNDVLSVTFNTAMDAATTKLSDHLGMFGSDGISAALSLMVEQGEKCRIAGTAMSNHWFMGDLFARVIRVAVPAAEEGLIVDGISAEVIDDFVNGENSAKVNYTNAKDYLTKMGK